MKKLLIALLFAFFPLMASASTAVPWQLVNLTDAFISPALVNGSAKGFIVNASSTINSNLTVASLFDSAIANDTVLSADANGQLISTLVTNPLINAAGTLSCLNASALQTGCLSSSDWSTFNGKQPAGSYATFGYPFPLTSTNFGATANATSSIVSFNAGLFSSSTSVIAATTFTTSGMVGIASTTPFGLFAVDLAGSATTQPGEIIHQQSGGTADLFDIYNFNASKYISVNSSGNLVGASGASFTGALGVAPQISNIRVQNGNSNGYGYIFQQTGVANATAQAFGVTSTNGASNNYVFFDVNSLGNTAVGTGTTPFMFAVQAAGTSAFGSQTPLFDVATVTSASFATSSLFRINPNGFVGIGTSTPTASLVTVAASTTLGTVQNAYFGVVNIIAGFENTTLKIFQEIDQWGHVITSGDAPTITGGTSSVSGNDRNGTITVVGTALTSVTLTFAHPYPAAPDCTESDNSTALTADITSISTTQVVFGFSIGVNSGTVWYICQQHQ